MENTVREQGNTERSRGAAGAATAGASGLQLGGDSASFPVPVPKCLLERRRGGERKKKTLTKWNSDVQWVYQTLRGGLVFL